MRGQWESVFHTPSHSNVTWAEFRADNTATVIVTTGDMVRTNTWSYRLEFERPPAASMDTLATITVHAAEGDCVLQQVNFGQHNAVQPNRVLVRIDGTGCGARDRIHTGERSDQVVVLADPWEIRDPTMDV